MTDQIDRAGRFTNDQGSSYLPGLAKSSSLSSTVNKKQIKRSLKPYRKYLPKDLGKLKGYSTGELEAIAARAVMKKRGHKPQDLRTSFNTKKYQNINYAKKVMAMEDPTKRQLKKTAAARKHIKTIRRNRQVMKLPLWKGVPKEARNWGRNSWG